MPADRSSDEWLMWINHELRTPLTSIIGQLELLLEGEYGEITDAQRDALEQTAGGAARLKLLADKLA